MLNLANKKFKVLLQHAYRCIHRVQKKMYS